MKYIRNTTLIVTIVLMVVMIVACESDSSSDEDVNNDIIEETADTAVDENKLEVDTELLMENEVEVSNIAERINSETSHFEVTAHTFWNDEFLPFALRGEDDDIAHIEEYGEERQMLIEIHSFNVMLTNPNNLGIMYVNNDEAIIPIDSFINHEPFVEDYYNTFEYKELLDSPNRILFKYNLFGDNTLNILSTYRNDYSEPMPIIVQQLDINNILDEILFDLYMTNDTDISIYSLEKELIYGNGIEDVQELELNVMSDSFPVGDGIHGIAFAKCNDYFIVIKEFDLE